MREKYESLSLAALKEIAKARGMRGLSAMKKSALIDALLSQDGQEGAGGQEKRPEAEAASGSEIARKKETGTRGRKTDRISGGGEASPSGATRTVRVNEAKRPAADGQARGRGIARKKPEEEARTFSSRQPGYRNARPGAAQRSGTAQNAGNTGSARYAGGAAGNAQGAAGNARYAGGAAGSTQGAAGNARYAGGAAGSPQGASAGNTRYAGGAAGSPQGAAGNARYAGGAAGNTQGASPAGVQQPEMPESASNNGMYGAVAEPVEAENRPERPTMELSQLDSGQQASGILEVMPDGYGFIRSANYLPGENDVYVSPSQIRKFNLKTGDVISGNTRVRQAQEKFSALLFLKKINGLEPEDAVRRYNFEDMTPVFPDKRLRMERGSREIAMRIVDLFSPIGKGQRGMIVSPPKAGKTTLLKEIARSIQMNDPNMKLLILLIDERPEEVTDIREAIQGENVEVIYSTFDELPEHHKRVSEMAIERAKRLVEHQADVTILLDSITRLARAYNLTVPPSGRTLSGGLDPAALHMPKRFFGAARNMREGGSLTILATALVDTGSKMDDVVYEEFKGTGNMELVLDRKLSEKRVFPAIDIPKSGTRREDLLLGREEQEAVYIMRRALNGMKSEEAVENILNMFVHTKDNQELVTRVRRQKFV